MEKYNLNIMQALRLRLNVEPTNEYRDEEIMSMDKRELFDDYLVQIGVHGRSAEILSVIENLYGLELESQRAKLITKGG